MKIGNSNPLDSSNQLNNNNLSKSNNNSSFLARGTGYYPANSKLEGGFNDRKGNPLNTLQDFLAGRAPYVSVAMDSKAFPYGTQLRIPELEQKYGRPIDFRVVDTGGAFTGKGTSRIDICTANEKASLDSTINGSLHLEVVNKPGANLGGISVKNATPPSESANTKNADNAKTTNNAGGLKGLPVKSAAPPEEKPIAVSRNILRQGATGTDVRHLQEALTKAGFNPGAKDGIFGPKTEAALKAFQESKGIAVDGIFGPETRGAFNDKVNNSPITKPGSPNIKPGDQSKETQGGKSTKNEGQTAKPTEKPATKPDTANDGTDSVRRGSGSISYNGKKVSDPALRNKLQQVADFFGRHITVTSGDRDFVPKGGSRTSLHLEHRAVDLHVDGLSDAQVFSRLKSSGLLDKGFEVIRHGPYTATGGPHIHIGHYDSTSRPSEFKVEGLTPGTGGNYRRVK
jgi:peptidoglycan hydrolase-like protein with peptidoglycan-binding domain/3D (Asp-Asp-Asp) domain-containing protein